MSAPSQISPVPSYDVERLHEAIGFADRLTQEACQEIEALSRSAAAQISADQYHSVREALEQILRKARELREQVRAEATHFGCVYVRHQTFPRGGVTNILRILLGKGARHPSRRPLHPSSNSQSLARV
nr:MAG TPA: hypothetical protein [Caudoviricetes sp.]